MCQKFSFQERRLIRAIWKRGKVTDMVVALSGVFRKPSLRNQLDREGQKELEIGILIVANDMYKQKSVCRFPHIKEILRLNSLRN